MTAMAELLLKLLPALKRQKGWTIAIMAAVLGWYSIHARQEALFQLLSDPVVGVCPRLARIEDGLIRRGLVASYPVPTHTPPASMFVGSLYAGEKVGKK